MHSYPEVHKVAKLSGEEDTQAHDIADTLFVPFCALYMHARQMRLVLGSLDRSMLICP